jgi:multidrug efflux pump subunit AcrB
MISLGNFALDNKKLFFFLVLVLLLGGGFAYYGMSKLEDPEIMVKQAMIVSIYPGASAHQIELEVTDVLEKNILSIKSVKEVNSRSMNDVSIISVGLKTTVQNDEVEQCWDMLRRKVNDTQSQLPEGVTSKVMDNFGDVFGMVYAMTFDGFSYPEAERYAQLIQRKIQTIDGISQVSIYGSRKECIYIDLNESRMSNLGVLPVEVLTTLKGQNQTIYAGYYLSGNQRLKVAVSDRYRNVEDIENLLIQGHENDQLRLKDMAKVSKAYEDPVMNEFRYDQQTALAISISALSGTDITKIGKKVDEVLSDLETSQLPAGIGLHKVFFQPEQVENSLNTFMINLIESVIIVIVLLMFTMGFRSGFIIGCSLGITVFGSLFILNMFDGTLQRVSIGSFVLAMGMLVDNSIVIIDGIQVDLQRGVSRRQALTAIGKKTAAPLLGATLIAVLAFLPIFLSPDTAGIYVRDLFIVLAVSLLLSWILALTFIPIHADTFLKIKKLSQDKDPYNSKFHQILRSTLRWVLTHRAWSLSIGITLVAISCFCFRFVKQGFFPDMTYNQLYIEYKLPEGWNSTQVKSDLEQIEYYLLARQEITHVTTSIGGTPSRYNLVRSIADPSLAYGELIVDYHSPEDLLKSMDEIQQYLTENFPDAFVRMKRYNLMYKKFPIEVEFLGSDPVVLRQLSQQAMNIMKASPYLCLITTDWEPLVPVLTVDYHQAVARDLGLSRQNVGMSLLAATNGIPIAKFYEGNQVENIYLRMVNKDGELIESLENTPVFPLLPSFKGIDRQTIIGLMTGAANKEDILSIILKTIPLSQATRGIRLEWDEPVVIRRNGERAMRVQCNPVSGMTTESARKSIEKQIESIPLPEGYSMVWQGEKTASQDATRYLFQSYPLAIVLMIAILIMLFKDYKKPVILILCLPLLIIGVIFGMLIAGKTFGFVSIVATLGLIGMMLKNGIVLMDEIDLQISAGVETVKALINSSSVRFRPVMMASLTTIVGMIPLLDDPLFGPGAVTIMGGLLIGSLTTLLFIPLLYSIFFRKT